MGTIMRMMTMASPGKNVHAYVLQNMPNTSFVNSGQEKGKKKNISSGLGSHFSRMQMYLDIHAREYVCCCWWCHILLCQCDGQLLNSAWCGQPHVMTTKLTVKLHLLTRNLQLEANFQFLSCKSQHEKILSIRDSSKTLNVELRK